MRRLSRIALFIGIATLSISFVVDGMVPWAVVIVAFCALWIMESRRGNLWAMHLGLVLFVGLAFYGIFRGYEPLLMLGVVLALLAAWDFEGVARNLAEVTERSMAGEMIRHHMALFGITVGVTLGLALIAQIVQLELSFWWIVAIASAAIIALTKALTAYQETTD